MISRINTALFCVSVVALLGRSVHADPAPDPLYRLANPSTGDHLFTTSFDEVISAIENFGYQYEFVAAKCFTTSQAGTVPFFRLRHLADHFYTTSEQEAEIAVAANGFTREGTACYVYPSQVAGSCPIYRISFSVHHFYTQSFAEVLADFRTIAGVTFEGVAAYAPPAGTGCPQ